MPKDNFSHISQNIQIRDICDEIFSGGTPSTKEETYWNGEIPWLSSGEIRNRYITNTDRKITQKGIDNRTYALDSDRKS